MYFLSSLKLKYRFLMHQDCVAINYIMPLKSPEGPKLQWIVHYYMDKAQIFALFFWKLCHFIRSMFGIACTDMTRGDQICKWRLRAWLISENWLNNDFHLTFHLCSAQTETYPRWSPQRQQPQRLHTSVALIFHRRSINPSEFICDTDFPGNQPPSTRAMQSSFSSCCFSVSCN